MWWMVGFSFLISVCLIPLIILFCKHFNLYDFVDKRKIHTGEIPRLGSVGFVPAFCLASIIYFHFSIAASGHDLMPLIIAGCIIFIFGLIDDIVNLRGFIKLLFQSIAAFIVVWSGHRFTQICFIQLSPVGGSILSFCWIIGIINAFNLIDGIDALCGGISFLILNSLGIIFYRSARPTAAICFILAASVAGFLVYNKPKAKIFMGDGGSQFLGFMAAALPLYKSTWNFEYNKFLVILVLVSIPLLDTVAAMWRRTREHRSFFSPDRSHIHHKLMNIGFTPKQVLLILLSIQSLLCLSSGLAMYLQESKGAILLCVTFAFMLLLFTIIHYTNRAVNRVKQAEEEANQTKPGV